MQFQKIKFEILEILENWNFEEIFKNGIFKN